MLSGDEERVTGQSYPNCLAVLHQVSSPAVLKAILKAHWNRVKTSGGYFSQVILKETTTTSYRSAKKIASP